MKKTIKARKVKDGWVVEIIQRFGVNHIQEVKDVVRYEGLKMEHHEPTEDNPNEFIYAD